MECKRTKEINMEIYTKSYQTKSGLVEGIQVKWAGFHILLVAGKKGFLACGVFDLKLLMLLVHLRQSWKALQKILLAIWNGSQIEKSQK